MKILRENEVFPMTRYSKMWDGIYDEFKVIKQRDAQKIENGQYLRDEHGDPIFFDTDIYCAPWTNKEGAQERIKRHINNLRKNVKKLEDEGNTVYLVNNPEASTQFTMVKLLYVNPKSSNNTFNYQKKMIKSKYEQER